MSSRSSTQGGPGYQTMVPGVEIYRLTFLDQRVGQASALAVFLTVLVLRHHLADPAAREAG